LLVVGAGVVDALLAGAGSRRRGAVPAGLDGEGEALVVPDLVEGGVDLLDEHGLQVGLEIAAALVGRESRLVGGLAASAPHSGSIASGQAKEDDVRSLHAPSAQQAPCQL